MKSFLKRALGFAIVLAMLGASTTVMIGLGEGCTGRQGQGSNRNQQVAHLILREAAKLITD